MCKNICTVIFKMLPKPLIVSVDPTHGVPSVFWYQILIKRSYNDTKCFPDNSCSCYNGHSVTAWEGNSSLPQISGCNILLRWSTQNYLRTSTLNVFILFSTVHVYSTSFTQYILAYFLPMAGKDYFDKRKSVQ